MAVEVIVPSLFNDAELEEKWERWNEHEISRESGFLRLDDYVYCLEHKCVHENNLSEREMSEASCWCDPANHQSIYRKEI